MFGELEIRTIRNELGVVQKYHSMEHVGIKLISCTIHTVAPSLQLDDWHISVSDELILGTIQRHIWASGII